MSSTPLEYQKSAFRRNAKVSRRQAALAVPDAALCLAKLYQESALASFNPRSVAGYLAIGDELDPMPLMEWLAKGGREGETKLALPAVVAADTPLEFRLYQQGDCLVSEAYGTKTPLPTVETCVPDLVLVPMLAFDARGYRMGYGGGFYDRTIAQYRQKYPLCRFVGVAYAAQQVTIVPIDAFDQPLDAILTEKAVIWSETNRVRS